MQKIYEKYFIKIYQKYLPKKLTNLKKKVSIFGGRFNGYITSSDL